MASHLSVNFDERLSGKSGYVHQSYKIDEIVRDWELCTNSSFTLWVVDDNFGTIGKSDGPNCNEYTLCSIHEPPSAHVPRSRSIRHLVI